MSKYEELKQLKAWLGFTELDITDTGIHQATNRRGTEMWYGVIRVEDLSSSPNGDRWVRIPAEELKKLMPPEASVVSGGFRTTLDRQDGYNFSLKGPYTPPIHLVRGDADYHYNNVGEGREVVALTVGPLFDRDELTTRYVDMLSPFIFGDLGFHLSGILSYDEPVNREGLITLLMR